MLCLQRLQKNKRVKFKADVLVPAIILLIVRLKLVRSESGKGWDGRKAVAQFDFEGRTRRELTFRKDDLITLFNRKSVDWWEGSLRGKTGLVPDKYLKILASTTSRAR